MIRAKAEFLKRLRQVVGDNRAAFARQIGISQPLLHGYLTGKHAPGFDFFLVLAERGVDINWLLTGAVSLSKTNGKPSKERNKELFSQGQRLSVLLAEAPAEHAEDIIEIVEKLVGIVSRKSERR